MTWSVPSLRLIAASDVAGRGKSACDGGCATTWPPLTPGADWAGAFVLLPRSLAERADAWAGTARCSSRPPWQWGRARSRLVSPGSMPGLADDGIRLRTGSPSTAQPEPRRCGAFALRSGGHPRVPRDDRQAWGPEARGCGDATTTPPGHSRRTTGDETASRSALASLRVVPAPVDVPPKPWMRWGPFMPVARIRPTWPDRTCSSSSRGCGTGRSRPRGRERLPILLSEGW